MSSFEFIFLMTDILKEPGIVIFVLSSLSTVFTYIFKAVNKSEIKRYSELYKNSDFRSYKKEICEAQLCFDNFSKFFKVSLLSTLISAPFAFLPTVDDLWRVRIGLIKYELASEENIEKGIDVIERMGKKLGCKYLGCEEKLKRGK